MEVGENGVSDGVVVREREGEVSFCRIERVGRSVLSRIVSGLSERQSEERTSSVNSA